MNNDVLGLDEYDKQIIHLLQEDATISNKALAAKINLAPSSCLMRVKALVNSGIIKKTIAIVDEKILGYQITAFLRVELKNINRYTRYRGNTIRKRINKASRKYRSFTNF